MTDFNKNKPKIRESGSAIKGFAKQYTVDGIAGTDAKTFLNVVKSEVVNLISKNRQTKINLVLFCEMERVDIKSGEVIDTTAPFVSKTEVVLDGTDVGELYNKASDKILESIAMFQMMGSNWRLRAVNRLEINTVAYKPLKGKSYIPVPEKLAAKKAIINMKNEDDECFKWCVTRALNSVEDHPERITTELREQAKLLDWNGIEFPVAVDENVIRRFERNNNVSVNIFGYDDDNENVHPLINSKNESEKVIDLLLISNGATKHYCWIKNFNKLCAARTEICHHTMHYCKRCLTGYRELEGLNRHNEYCSLHGVQRVEVPKAGTRRFFKHHFKSMRVPFVVYADFESFIKPIGTCQPNSAESYTNKYQKHSPSSFCYLIKCFDDSLYKQDPVVFTAENETDDVAQIFVGALEQNIKDIYQQFKFSKKMIFTEKDKAVYKATTICHICEGAEGEFREDDKRSYIKVRDHCHLTGKFRGAAHSKCNLEYRVPKFFPVLFHNLSGYDCHLFIKKLRSIVDNGEKITCIPNNEEKYISFSKKIVVDTFINKEGKETDVKRELRFIDSFRFMPSSLDALSKNLKDKECLE